MNLLEVTLPTAAENLAFDEALLLTVEEQGRPACLRIWECPSETVILGSSCRIQNDVHVDACRRDRVPVLRRCSGGGTVLLGPGCLIYSLVGPVSPEQHLEGIKTANAAILGRIAKGLKPLAPAIGLDGTSDLTWDGRKVSGNSQRWLRRTLLHHGTLLCDFEIERVARYLKLPERQPEYRRRRGHAEFLTNLPLPQDALRRRLIEIWNGTLAEGFTPPYELAAELARTKYETDAWNLRL